MRKALKATFTNISKSILNIKKLLSSKLFSDGGVVINNRDLNDITPNQLTVHIQQFYQTAIEQQANTIKLPIDYSKGLLTDKDKNLTNNEITKRYGVFFGIHQNFYWFYFYKENVFISFYDDKILFTLNKADDYLESYNKAILDKDANKSIYQLFKGELNIFVERSKLIINWIHQNQILKELLTQYVDSRWPSFFNSPVALSRFDNKVFEIITPSAHLSTPAPMGSKIILYPFDGYFKKSNFYSKHFRTTAIELDTYLKDSLDNSNANYNGYYIYDYWAKIGEMSKNSSQSNINKSLFNGLDKMLINIKHQIYELCDVKVASPKLYYLFGFVKPSLRPEEENLEKVWITYDSDSISKFDFHQDFAYVHPYQGDNLDQSNIFIINNTIMQINDYIKRLVPFINKTEKELDLYNITTDSLESYELLSFLRSEIERMQFHLEYLDDFSQQLFPQEIEVI